MARNKLEKSAMADDEDRRPKTDDDYKRMHRKDEQNIALAERTHVLNIANEAAIKYAESAVKAVMLINGGASVSLLAFIGGLAAQGKVQLSGLSLFANSLMWFASGVLSAAVMAGFAYFATYCAAAQHSAGSFP